MRYAVASSGNLGAEGALWTVVIVLTREGANPGIEKLTSHTLQLLITLVVLFTLGTEAVPLGDHFAAPGHRVTDGVVRTLGVTLGRAESSFWFTDRVVGAARLSADTARAGRTLAPVVGALHRVLAIDHFDRARPTVEAESAPE